MGYNEYKYIFMSNDDSKEMSIMFRDMSDRLIRIEAKLPKDGFDFVPVHALKIEQHSKAIDDLQTEAKTNVVFKTKTAVYFAIIFFIVQTAISVGIAYYSRADSPSMHRPSVHSSQTNNFVLK